MPFICCRRFPLFEFDARLAALIHSPPMTYKLALGCFSTLIAAALLFAQVPLCLAQNEVKLPADFPKDIPLYKNAKLVRAGNYMDNPKLGKEYRFDTADPVEAVISFYKAQLPANGWTITEASFVANPNTITVMKGRQMAMVSPNRVMAEGGGQVTRIEITLLPTK